MTNKDLKDGILPEVQDCIDTIKYLAGLAGPELVTAAEKAGEVKPIMDVIYNAQQVSRTPAIADGSDLFICRRSTAGDDHDGATRYYVYQELRPYDGAIPDGVGVELNTERILEIACTHEIYRNLQEGIDDQIRIYHTFSTRRLKEFAEEVVREYLVSTPPQAATDEG
ncbi:MAG: hypothetical protein WC130_03665 [Kiritimatiellia bacterium]